MKADNYTESIAGILIVIDGPDGSGTTRQTEFLVNNLRQNGIDTVATSEPTEGPIGRSIRSLLQSGQTPDAATMQLLFTADRADHAHNTILPALNAGKVVVTDRYRLSTVIYGTALGLDQQWLTTINEYFPAPDLTFITLPPFAVCQERLAKRHEQDAYETTELQQQVYSLYEKLTDGPTTLVDTSQSKAVTSAEIWSAVQRYLENR